MKNKKTNEKIIEIFKDIAEILDVNSVFFKSRAYKKAIISIQELDKDLSIIYQEQGIKGLKSIKSIGESIAKKIEEYLKKGKIKYYDEIKTESAIRLIITHYFKTKGLTVDELKRDAKKRKIIYSRFTKPAKQLLDLAGSLENAKKAMDKVASWANSRKLDYSIETVFKKWLELDKLKPKEIVKKPYYRNDPMIWSETKKKWYVIDKYNEWLEFADKEDKIEWRIEE